MWTLLALACGGAPQDEPAGPEPEPWFDEAVLDPPFLHANALWAGVALADFDGDGWTDILFSNGKNLPPSLYFNQGDGTFVEGWVQEGADDLDEDTSVAVGDVDGDGDPDVVMTSECELNAYNENTDVDFDVVHTLYRNRGDGTFEGEVIQTSGVALDRACTVSLHLADVDLDGDLDLLLANGIHPQLTVPWAFRKQDESAYDVVLYNDGTGHWPVAEKLDGNAATFALAVVDLDGDGQPEILQGRGGEELQVQRREGDRWVLDPDRSETGTGVWMGIAVADFDGDLDLDVYATNEGLSTLISGFDNLADLELEEGAWVHTFHALHRNEGGVLVADPDWPLEADHLLAGDLFDGMDGRYPELVGPEGLGRLAWGWGVVALDADADGWPDVAFTGNNCSAPMDIIWDEEHGAGPGGLLRNLAGEGFRDVTWEAGIANVDAQGRYQDGRGIAVGDLDGDGYADLVFANRTYNPSQSDPMAQEVGVPHVWLSRPRAGHFLVVDPVGTASNRDGLGTVLEVRGPDRTQVLVLGAGGATNSTSEPRFLVGLGEATEVDLLVRFPSGAEVELAGVQADTWIEVVEP